MPSATDHQGSHKHRKTLKSEAEIHLSNLSRQEVGDGDSSPRETRIKAEM